MRCNQERVTGFGVFEPTELHAAPHVKNTCYLLVLFFRFWFVLTLKRTRTMLSTRRRERWGARAREFCSPELDADFLSFLAAAGRESRVGNAFPSMGAMIHPNVGFLF